jgi:hypothetical protein
VIAHKPIAPRVNARKEGEAKVHRASGAKVADREIVKAGVVRRVAAKVAEASGVMTGAAAATVAVSKARRKSISKN